MAHTPQQPDIRWKQRLDNFNAALEQLSVAVKLSQSRSLTDLEKIGLIKAFEFCHELAWNVMKDYLEYEGVSGIVASRDATREAFNKRIITGGDIWMEMIKSRNLSSHTYNKKIADTIANDVEKKYFQLFVEFQTKMTELSKEP